MRLIMEINFDTKDSVADFVSVPQGTYLCRVAEVRVGETKSGDARWSLRLLVADGQHVGKQAAWDSLVFSVRGRARAASAAGARDADRGQGRHRPWRPHGPRRPRVRAPDGI